MSQNLFELKKYINPNVLIKTGKVLSKLGTGLLLTETFLGLLAIDIALLITITNESKKSGNSNSFLMGYLWGSLSRNHWCFVGTDLLGITIASFIESIVAASLLAFQFHMPIIAIAVAAAWVGTVGITLLGNMLQKYGEELKSSNFAPQPSDYPPPYSASTDCFRGCGY